MAAAEPVPADPCDPVDDLVRAATVVAERELDGLSEEDLRREMDGLEQARRRTQARQYRVADEMRRREVRRLREAGTDDAQAGRRAERRVRRELTDGLQWTPSDAKRATTMGRELQWAHDTRRAFDAGDLSPRHAQVLAGTLRWLEGEQHRQAEERLLALAAEQDAVTFGRSCRRLLAKLDHDAAMSEQQRRHARRAGRMSETADGMLVFSGELSGLAAEEFATGVHAFRRPDAPGERRSPEQATADAVAEMARAALGAAEAPTQHGVRPHVVVTVDHEAILRNAGVAESLWTGPLPFGEVRRLLADCGVSRLLTDTRGVAVEAGEEVRSVPVGLYRGLVLRDGGCIGVGCDAPPAWCDVMHLEVPYRLQGRLTLQTAALGCKEHHRLFDLCGWKVNWREGRPVLHPPGRPPDGPTEPSPGKDVDDRDGADPGTRKAAGGEPGGARGAGDGPDGRSGPCAEDPGVAGAARDGPRQGTGAGPGRGARTGLPPRARPTSGRRPAVSPPEPPGDLCDPPKP